MPKKNSDTKPFGSVWSCCLFAAQLTIGRDDTVTFAPDSSGLHFCSRVQRPVTIEVATSLPSYSRASGKNSLIFRIDLKYFSLEPVYLLMFHWMFCVFPSSVSLSLRDMFSPRGLWLCVCVCFVVGRPLSQLQPSIDLRQRIWNLASPINSLDIMCASILSIYFVSLSHNVCVHQWNQKTLLIWCFLNNVLNVYDGGK